MINFVFNTYPVFFTISSTWEDTLYGNIKNRNIELSRIEFTMYVSALHLTSVRSTPFLYLYESTFSGSWWPSRSLVEGMVNPNHILFSRKAREKKNITLLWRWTFGHKKLNYRFRFRRTVTQIKYQKCKKKIFLFNCLINTFIYKYYNNSMMPKI